MRVDIEEHAVDVDVRFDVSWRVAIDPGLWVVEHRGQEAAITSLHGGLIEGLFRIAFPKGVTRNIDGIWSIQERILVGILPPEPLKAWKSIPPRIRDAIDDSYLLAVSDLPAQVVPA